MVRTEIKDYRKNAQDKTECLVHFPDCVFCGKEIPSMWVNWEAHDKWRSGALIQECFPEMSATDREIFISGMCPACQKEVFGE